MDYKDLDTVIESQVKFVKENSNSISNRVNILNSLLISIKHNESRIYEALKQDLNKHEFESFLSEILLVKKEIKLLQEELIKRDINIKLHCGSGVSLSKRV